MTGSKQNKRKQPHKEAPTAGSSNEDEEGDAGVQTKPAYCTTKISWCCKMDNILLDYVLTHHCWDLAYGTTNSYWDECAEFLDDVFHQNFKNHMKTNTLSGTAVHTRFTLIINHFRKNEKAALYKSGDAEDYTKKEQVLTAIVAEMDASIARRNAEHEEQTQEQIALEEDGRRITESACSPEAIANAKKRKIEEKKKSASILNIGELKPIIDQLQAVDKQHDEEEKKRDEERFRREDEQKTREEAWRQEQRRFEEERREREEAWREEERSRQEAKFQHEEEMRKLDREERAQMLQTVREAQEMIKMQMELMKCLVCHVQTKHD